MAITLAESAKLSQNDLQRGVIEMFVQQSPILDRLPLIEMEGNAYAYDEEATLPGVAFRDVNAGYTESTGTVNQKTETLKILGGDADVDKFIQQTRSNLNDQRATQLRMKVKSLSYAFQDAFFNGDVTVDPLSFDGLKKRLVSGQVISAATDGLPVVGSSDADRHAFLDKLDETIAQVENPSAIYMNRQIAAKFRSAARRLTQYDQTVDEFGRQVATYDGLPILDPGYKADGSTLILPQDETQGTSSVTSSIYVVSFGEGEGDRAVTGLTNGGVQAYDLGELETKPAYRHRIEFYVGMGVFGGHAAARLKGVLNG